MPQRDERSSQCEQSRRNKRYSPGQMDSPFKKVIFGQDTLLKKLPKNSSFDSRHLHSSVLYIERMNSLID